MNWSLSKLGTFTKCRRRFLYSYLQGLTGTPQPRGAKDRGVDTHAIIEDYFKGKSETLPVELLRYKAWFDMLREYNYHSEAKLAMLAGWLPADWEHPEVWWKGVLDLLVLNGNGAWVFDWKTGKVYPDHENQKELYAIATFITYPQVEEIEAWHVYLDLNGKDTKKKYTREQLPEMIAKWNRKLIPYMQAMEYYGSISDGNPYTVEWPSFFVTNPSYLCNYCPFSKNPCPH